MVLINIDGTDFAVHDDHVSEWGTMRRYDPKRDKGYIMLVGRRYGLCSFANFGDDQNMSERYAERWCAKARRAWNCIRG